MSTRPLGRHMPLDGNLNTACETARAIGCDAIQIFVSSPRIWSPPAISPEEISRSASILQEYVFMPIVVHAAYLINLASTTPETREKSRTLLRWTLLRSASIGAHEIVLHCGSHGGDGLETGIERIIEGIRLATEGIATGPRILLENDVGAGNTVGQFEVIAKILQRLKPIYDNNFGICVDTAHLWGAGYDIDTPAAAIETVQHIDVTVGLHHVKVIHLNNTTVKLGSHRDIHARLSEGIISQSGLSTFVADPRLHHATVILETPIQHMEHTRENDWQADREQIALARSFMAG